MKPKKSFEAFADADADIVRSVAVAEKNLPQKVPQKM